jgi:predicted hydrocarbon binding protein
MNLELVDNELIAKRRTLAEQVIRIQSITNTSDEEVSDILHIARNQFNLFQKGLVEIPTLGFLNLSKHFGFSIDAFFDNNVDFEVIRQHHLKNYRYLPQKYTKGAFSKKQLIITVLDYVESHFGWTLKEAALDYFQIKNFHTFNPSDSINVYLFEDLLNFLVDKGLTRQDIIAIGHHSIVTTQGTELSHKLSSCRTIKELFQLYFEEIIDLIERNNKYRMIKMTNNFCEVLVEEIDDNLDIFKVKHIGGQKRCDYRAGALSAATNYIGLKSCVVEEVTCAHKGDDNCIYHISFEQLNSRNEIYH